MLHDPICPKSCALGQHIPQDPAGDGTVQAGAVGSPIRLGKHTCLIRVRKPPP